ncbi:hypothetical protein BKH46_08270 [Helicobacter sp. 12S02634-8]|uniref:ribbon-helix-helix protein, CopG family n=1 Tax=Helicobacter sp. 12S02634-8 TaxID=1476199 RepID=UPI000BA7BD52|nr:ribbon-helix-helix protein, CopG family [Helicobacter sp. 12S02634-8]PAF46226.1 hypothetical protein BKH46_08270 [Helicobacter sp. 12S02634-8]
MKQVINIRLPQDLIAMLDNVAKEVNLNRTALIERAVLAYQDKLDEMVADKRIDEMKVGDCKPISYDEAKRILGWD